MNALLLGDLNFCDDQMVQSLCGKDYWIFLTPLAAIIVGFGSFCFCVDRTWEYVDGVWRCYKIPPPLLADVFIALKICPGILYDGWH